MPGTINKRLVILGVILVILIGITAFVYINQARSGAASNVGTDNLATNTPKSVINNGTIDVSSLLQNSLFKALEPLPELPPRKAKAGRANPFAPSQPTTAPQKTTK